MRKKILLIMILLATSTFVAFRVYNKEDDGKKDKLLGQVINQVLKMGHYKTLNLDEKFSENMYKIYINKLDHNKRFLLKEDLELLKRQNKSLAEEIKTTNYKFFDQSIEIWKKRMLEAEEMCKKILKQPFNFKKNDSFETNPDKQNYPKNQKEKYARWHSVLKYQAMIKLNRLMKIQQAAIESKDTSHVVLSQKDLEKKARKELAEDYKDVFRRYKQINRNDWLASYLTAYTECYDPHSQYMAPKTRDNFDIGMSGKFEGIGATLTEKHGYIKVVKILPGSPSWRQGELKEEDLILKVAQGDSTPVNVVDMRLDEAVQLIRGKKGTQVKLTVKKPDNTIVVIAITRDVIVFEETFAKSAILKIDNSEKRYGYIYLPSFYIDFRHIKTGRHCADDIAKEIIKLKKEQVDGIIFDLRNNTGGSLGEVVKIAGFFIKNGPVVQVKSRLHKSRILKDKDNRVVYDGDLVVLVNSLSASASEIFAAAMQDYHRAIIVGAQKTHGKGTVQNIIDLDRMLVKNADNVKPLGSLRMTIQKFYRINGGATQIKGVTPDVILPDIYDAYNTGENTLEHALKWDEIDSAQYTLWALPISNMDEIKRNSKERIKNNKVFRSILNNTKRVRDEKKNSILSLNIKKYREEQDKLNEEAKQFKKDLSTKTSVKSFMLDEDSLYFKAIMDKSLNEKMSVDSSKFISRKQWIEDLTEDPAVEEAVFIMKEIK